MTSQPAWDADAFGTPEQARDGGMAAAENAADPRVILIIDGLIAEYNDRGLHWSANDIRERVPVSAGPLVGARVRAAAMRRPREMVKVGEEPSTLRSTHAKNVAVWKGVAE